MADSITQSDDRQYSPIWSPDGKWIVYEQDHAAMNVGSLRVRAMAEKSST